MYLASTSIFTFFFFFCLCFYLSNKDFYLPPKVSFSFSVLYSIIFQFTPGFSYMRNTSSTSSFLIVYKHVDFLPSYKRNKGKTMRSPLPIYLTLALLIIVRLLKRVVIFAISVSLPLIIVILLGVYQHPTE